MARSPERVGQKINLERLLADLRMQRFHIHGRRLGPTFRVGGEEFRRAGHELAATLRDLVCVDIGSGQRAR